MNGIVAGVSGISFEVFMSYAIWFISALCAYLIGGINPSILLSKLIYHEDIRAYGSGNPGFTNFKRAYGMKFAWIVFLIDFLKALLPCWVFNGIFAQLGYDPQLGAVFTGLFVMIGHSFPVYYGFKGGKGFLSLLGVLFVTDWRAGIIAMAVLCILLLTVKYMSLSTMSALVAGTVALFAFGANVIVGAIYGVCVIFMIWRHRENIKRLLKGTESKFSFGSKKQ